jgi:hypothetical protein
MGIDNTTLCFAKNEQKKGRTVHNLEEWYRCRTVNVYA